MKMIFRIDLDQQVKNLIYEMESRYNVVIALLENENGSQFMDVYIVNSNKCIPEIPVSDSGSKDRLCCGIRGWFRANGNYI